MDNKYIDRMKHDGDFRFFFTSVMSGGWNFVYAVFNFVLAGMYRSYWFVTLGVYYLLLGCMRGAILAHGRSSKDKRKAETPVRHIGIAFFFLAFLFAMTVLLSIRGQRGTDYGTIVMITMAAFTFYLLTMAIINSVKVRKKGELKALALRNISLGGAAVSLFSLEKSMLATFGKGSAAFTLHMEAASGAGIFLILAALGIDTIRKSKKETDSQN